MKRIYLFFLISLFVSSCNSKETITIEDEPDTFPVLSYDAEILETLSLDKSKITIADTREVLYWSKSFQNVKNNLGNIKTSSTLKDKRKIFSGSGKIKNTTSSIYFDDKLSITSKKVSPKKNDSPNILAKLIPPPSDREQNIPMTVTIDPNNNVAFLRDQFF